LGLRGALGGELAERHLGRAADRSFRDEVVVRRRGGGGGGGGLLRGRGPRPQEGEATTDRRRGQHASHGCCPFGSCPWSWSRDCPVWQGAGCAGARRAPASGPPGGAVLQSPRRGQPRREIYRPPPPGASGEVSKWARMSAGSR